MKKLLLSIMAVFSALSMSAAIDLNDPTTYTSKVYDFVTDAALNGQTLATDGNTCCGTAYETGNKIQQKIYKCTAPEALDGVMAFQAVTGSKCTKMVQDKGMQNYGATRSAAFLNLKAGQIAVFESTAETDFTGGGTNEGTYTVSKSTDKLTATITMTSDGNLGFCIAKNACLTKVTIYKEKVAGQCEAPVAVVTGTAGTSRVITITDDDQSAKIYWSETKNQDYKEYTAPVTTGATVIYAYADNGVKSDTISFKTGAGTLVKLNGVTATRTGDNTYTVASSQVNVTGNPTATVAYSVNGGEAKTVASGSSITIDADFKAWAVVQGYTNSDTLSVKFIAPYDKGGLKYNADFITLGSDKAGFTPGTTAADSLKMDGVDGVYYYSTLNNIYLQNIKSGNNYTWLYRSGKGNSNFKCQYATAYMVFKDMKKGTVVDIYAGGDNNVVPVTDIVNGECGYNYSSHYFVKATADGNLAVKFAAGSYIMSATVYGMTANFDDLTLDAESAKQYATEAGFATFKSGSFTFQNYNSTSKWGTYYYAFTLTDKTTTTGTDWNNPYESACGGAKSGKNYVVWYSNSYNGGDSIVFDNAGTITGFYVTNTTYTQNVIINGNSSGRKLNQEGDNLILHITGYDATGKSTGTVDYTLASTTGNKLSYVKAWRWVDLSKLSAATKYVKFDMTGTDTGTYGLNTPTYFAMDDLGGVAPEKDADLEEYTFTSTDIDVVEADSAAKSGKFFVNGRIIIVKDGKKYNAAGVEMK